MVQRNVKQQELSLEISDESRVNQGQEEEEEKEKMIGTW